MATPFGLDDVRGMQPLQVLALTMWGEARGDKVDGSSLVARIAVAWVARNRLGAAAPGDTYTDVCLRPAQFSCWSPDVYGNNAALMRLASDVSHRRSPFDTVYMESYWLASEVSTGDILDPTHGATHYYELMSKVPAWAAGQVPLARLGSHLFFKVP